MRRQAFCEAGIYQTENLELLAFVEPKSVQAPSRIVFHLCLLLHVEVRKDRHPGIGNPTRTITLTPQKFE